ncbi:hypothetical protein CK203_113198 [Vitis vinifera]|uniref:Uncharacterized protein n=1 Tax=Vitis vinifera TaxID=29760 RepID=A0A438CTR4_VITVI|nr:hypothetical protein CK203_113198 [Vitis vinifera]
MSIFVAKPVRNTLDSLREFSQLRRRVWHTSATSQHRSPHFATAKRLRSGKAQISQQNSHSAGLFISFLKPHRASLRSSSPTIRSGQISATRNGANRGAKSSSPSSRKKSLRKEPVPDPVSEPPRPRAISPSVKPAQPKLQRGVTLPAFAGFISGILSSILASSISVPSPAPPAKPQEPQPPLPEPQIPAEIALEEVIRRPMLTQPPIEGNLDCRARPFHSELCFDIAAF